jgi:hypothetical protein
MSLSQSRIGVYVYCRRCHNQKKPVGRSGPMELRYCTDDSCDGYWTPPLPGSLWPGETEADFGYPVKPEGTNEA